MKKPLLLLFSASFLFIAGCGDDEGDEVINSAEEHENTPSLEEQKAESDLGEEPGGQITEHVGLGDPRDSFNEAYGENENNEEIARYQGDFMIVNFENERAISVELQFADFAEEMTDDEKLTFIEGRIPIDAKEMSRNTNDQNINEEIIEYQSELLVEHISEESFEGNDPGTFTVVLTSDEHEIINATMTIGTED
ncbi:hypothetical protein [Cytobacillus gottheilii]|uniref:Lipoprotein n=1 Tax=Cytobacillus gottheilii TaxID=859144 RepID=A0ABX8FFW6_9BACI|nr:hypothetical protein [Cytobacillus gottheilii]QVY62931.1 hypothetical protein J1899_07770 [Cytobacillus gottheilii]